MDVDTRLLRYFLAVVAEGSLTRAAQQLWVSQPALTKQIRQLESLLDVKLFVRSRAGMTLTEPGRTLAQRAPTLVAAVDEAVRETKSTASRISRVLRVGFLPSATNEAISHIIAAFANRRPGWRVEMRQANWSDPSGGLVGGEVDAALVRLPFPGQERLRIEVLLTEPRCVALPSSHPFADRDRIAFRELWEEPFVAARPETGWWRDYWLATDERGGHPVRIGAVTDQPDEWLNAVANGYGIALAPASAARFYARPGVIYRTVTGVSSTHLGVAWTPSADGDPAVRDFTRCCLDNRLPPDDETGSLQG